MSAFKRLFGLAEAPAAAAQPRPNPANDCYFEHHSAASERFACIDGVNMVCPRCCLESCVPRTPEWFARCSAMGHPTWPAHMRDKSANLPVAPPRKIVVLETYWGNHNARLFQNTSVRPFLDALSTQLHPPLQVAHRFVESLAQLSYYVSYPDGLCWRDREVSDAPIFYLSFHGSPGGLISSLETVEGRALYDSFRGWGGQHAKLVHFGACSVFAGEAGHRFAREFLAASGCHAVLGYTTDIDWMDSMMTDLLFLRRFFSSPDPWKNLADIHAGVLADFAPAKRLGYELHLRAA